MRDFPFSGIAGIEGSSVTCSPSCHNSGKSYEVNLDAMRTYSSVSGREKTTNELPRRDEDVLGNELDTT